MKDWKQIAAGLGADIPEADLAKITPALDALEAVFRPLARDIPENMEPAVTFRVEEDPA